MIGALTNFVSNSQASLRIQNKKSFQPMPANFGLLPELDNKVKNKRERYKRYRDRSLEHIQQLKETF
jgi:tRNA uridine 5-carboxymethylaminomethyl modification enzyme/methylenetetrahydrofolate--tRNA-(uracil-5-)-methyltransferase